MRVGVVYVGTMVQPTRQRRSNSEQDGESSSGANWSRIIALGATKACQPLTPPRAAGGRIRAPSPSHINDLPDELLECVFRKLDYKEESVYTHQQRNVALGCAAICRRWRAIVDYSIWCLRLGPAVPWTNRAPVVVGNAFCSSVSRFTNLSTLYLMHCHVESWSMLAMALYHSCPSLASVHLIMVTIDRDQLGLLCQGCPALQTLVLDRAVGNFVSLPDALFRHTTLRRLQLSDSSAWQQLPEALGQLKSLQELELKGCWWIELPSALGKLVRLEKLELDGCHRLALLPAFVGNLQALRSLRVRFCGRLLALPETLGKLTALEDLMVNFCSEIAFVPDSLGKLKSLRTLRLTQCLSLRALPPALGQLTNLRAISLRYCGHLKDLPDTLGQLRSLEELDLIGCRGLTSLPKSLTQLKSLRMLLLQLCENIRKLPSPLSPLSSLCVLDMSDCVQLQLAPGDLQGLSGLEKLDLCVHMLPAAMPCMLGGLDALCELALGGSTIMDSLPEALESVTQLRSLSLEKCSRALATHRSSRRILRHLKASGILVRPPLT